RVPSAQYVRARNWFHVADLVEEIRAEERTGVLFEQDAGVPAVRQVRGGNVPVLVAAGFDHLVLRKAAGRTNGEVLDVDRGAHLAADGLGARSNREPGVQCAALVNLEVTPADPAQSGGVDQRRNRVADLGEHPTHAGMKQQRLVVSN